MLPISSLNDAPDTDLEDELEWLRTSLATKGVQANSVAETKHVCCEGIRSFHLFVLPPRGLSFAAAKAIDSSYGVDFDIFYPSLKDIFDIKNGRVPEISRGFVSGLKYHGRPRESWMDLAVDLVREDGICVGRGVCQKHEAMDCVDEEPLGEYHVGVRFLEVLDNLFPSHWKGALRRWRTTHVLYNGISLFECLRQHMQDAPKYRFCEDGSDSAGIAGVLKDQCISSVSPWISISKELTNVNARHLSIVDGLVLGKFRFLNNTGKNMKETESVQQWLAHHTAKETDKEKKKWEKQAAKSRMQAQKKLKEQASKTRMEEQKKWETQLAKARTEEQKKSEEQVAKISRGGAEKVGGRNSEG